MALDRLFPLLNLGHTPNGFFTSWWPLLYCHRDNVVVCSCLHRRRLGFPWLLQVMSSHQIPELSVLPVVHTCFILHVLNLHIDCFIITVFQFLIPTHEFLCFHFIVYILQWFFHFDSVPNLFCITYRLLLVILRANMKAPWSGGADQHLCGGLMQRALGSARPFARFFCFL